MNQLDLRVDGKYRLLKRLGSGKFGAVYEAVEIDSENHVAIKLEHHRADPQFLKCEIGTYKLLAKGRGVPRVYSDGFDCEYYYMAFDLLGPTLEDLLNYCRRKLSLKTVLLLADQLLSRLQYIHSRGVIHRDIKPENMLMGIGLSGNKVYITDFGLCTGDFSAVPDRPRTFVGTKYYASVNGHLGEMQSNNDDLMSLGYTLVYLLCGTLPWDKVDGESEEEKDAKTLKMKQEISSAELCKDLPLEFLTYFDSLKSDSKPQHHKLRKLFRRLFYREKFEFDNVYDWTILKYMEQEASKHDDEGTAQPDLEDMEVGTHSNTSKDQSPEADKECEPSTST